MLSQKEHHRNQNETPSPIDSHLSRLGRLLDLTKAL